MTFSYRKQTGGEKIWLSCGGMSIFAPPLCWFQLPCHSQAELSSPNGLKDLGGGTKTSAMVSTFLLVLVKEEATEDRNYGLLTVWVNP